ncbi:MAG: TolC family protein [Chitinophagaceae bacterium]
MRTVFFNQLIFRVFFLILLGTPGIAFGRQGILTDYVDSAFASSRVIAQKNLSLEKARTGLEIARSYFLPEVNLLAGYQTAGGGRAIELPLADLLNNAYSTLNQLTGTNQFPQLKNQSVNFFPRDFHDVKLRATYPILNPDIRFGRDLAEQQIVMSELEIDLYKRDLVLSVKTAYFNYLSAGRAVAIYQNALELAEESKRVNERLLQNGKGLPAYVLRADSEVEQVKASLSQASTQLRNAALYFNFLLNRDPLAPIDSSYSVEEGLQVFSVPEQSLHPGSTLREELSALKQGISINETLLNQRKAAFRPRLNSFLDLGNQSEHWQFNSQSRYYLLGLQLELPIFTGQRNRLKVRQAELDLKAASLQLEQVADQLNLSQSAARNNLNAALDQLKAGRRQMESAATYQRLIERGFREGSNSFIETIDARSQYTQAQLQYTIQQYKALIAAAELERQNASYPLK